MGKYYTIIDNSIYIYTTGSDGILDISKLPRSLEIFNENVQWQISPWLAMSQTNKQDSLKILEEILISQGFINTLICQSVLENYFITGNTEILSKLIEEDIDTSIYNYKVTENSFEIKIDNGKLILARNIEKIDI